MIPPAQLAFSSHICRMFLIGALMVGSAPVYALNPDTPLSQYIHTSWGSDVGLPAVRRLAQTPDGYLWLATRDGLKRFDGVRFSTYLAGPATGLESSTMQDLVVGPDGSLWIATLGGGVANYKGGIFHSYIYRSGLPSEEVECMYRDGQGVLWVGTRDGKIARFVRGNFQEVAIGIPNVPITSFAEDKDQSLWIATFGNGVFRLEKGILKSFSVKDGLPDARVSGLYRDHSGTIWTAGWKGISFWNGRRFVRDAAVDAIVRYATTCKEDRDGNLWIASSSGLVRARDGRIRKMDHHTGLSDDFVSDVFEDREGDLWVATRSGLDRLKNGQIRTFTSREGLPHDTGPIIADSAGAVWTVSGKQIVRVAANKITTWPLELPRGSRPFTMLSQFDSHFLIGFARGGDFWGPHGISSAPYLAGLNVRCMLKARDGEIWIATADRGLVRWDPRSRSLLDTGVTDRFIVTLAEDQTGAIWAGSFSGGGLYRVAGKQIGHFGRQEGLLSPNIYALFVDSKNKLWIGSANGLSWFENGRILTANTRQGLQSDLVWAIVDDAYDRLWFAGYGGIETIDKKSLTEWAAGRIDGLTPHVYRRTDGLQVSTVDRPFPNAVRSADGNLWFCITDGIVEIMPPEPAVSLGSKFSVLVEDATVDGVSHFQPDRIAIAPGARSIEIRYTALTLSSPETVRFRYRLEGLDRDWIDADVRRIAYYNNLKPGDYTFRVEATAGDEHWHQSAPLSVEQIPFFYQTQWFRLAAVGVFFALLWGLYRLRLLQLTREFNARLEERVSERARIARELHDSLLQGFQGLLFRLQAVHDLIPKRPSAAIEALDIALDRADKAIAEGRATVSELRGTIADDKDIAEALNSFSEELSAESENGSSSRVSVLVQGTPRELDPLVRDEIHRIAREALRNAVLHAKAQDIEAEITYTDSEFLLHIRDNGIGIAPQVANRGARAGHWGLPGMRERAHTFGGKLGVWSQDGAGTEIELIVPASIAYRISAARRSFWSLRKKYGGNE